MGPTKEQLVFEWGTCIVYEAASGERRRWLPLQPWILQCENGHTSGRQSGCSRVQTWEKGLPGVQWPYQVAWSVAMPSWRAAATTAGWLGCVSRKAS